MNTKIQKESQNTSFTVSDIASTRLAMFWGGISVIIAAVVVVAFGGVSAYTNSDIRAATEVVLSAATKAEKGSVNYYAGGSEQLDASVQIISTADALVGKISGSFLVSLTNAKAARLISESWRQMVPALDDVSVTSRQATDLAKAMGPLTGNFAQLAKSIESTGRANTEFKREYESAVRLYTYAESGFGSVSIPRIEYDLRVIGQGLDSSDLKGAVAFAAPLRPMAKSAIDNPIKQDQLIRIKEVASRVKEDSSQILAATSTQGLTYYFLIAFLMCAAGVALLYVSLATIVGDVETKYALAIQQFKGAGIYLKDLVNRLKEVEAGSESLVTLSNKNPECAEIGKVVNAILKERDAKIEGIRLATVKSVESQHKAMENFDQIQSYVSKSLNALSSANEALTDAKRLSECIQLDSKAAAFAAHQSDINASNAKRLSQDASSRIDALREGLQETSKGIKRFGERAQEINAGLDEMESLSEQIGALAVNANLEAERAGEAGAGFKLVAREVQALARKSEDSLSKMATLIQGAQSDARSATDSMEKSTAQIVAGTNLGAVSQSLLSAMGPLAHGVSQMTKAVTETGKASEEAVSLVLEKIHVAMDQSSEIMASAEKTRSPIKSSIASLSIAVR